MLEGFRSFLIFTMVGKQGIYRQNFNKKSISRKNSHPQSLFK